MYKVFVNDKPLFLTNTIEKETDFQIFLLESVDMIRLIQNYQQQKIQKAILYHPDEKKILKKLKEKLTVNKAAGGLVKNSKGEILFIYRSGKWDLPKGGIEKGEELHQTAIREVEEETGVSGLEITEKLSKTYHVFKRNGEFRLKVTQWFAMKTAFTGLLEGQIEEGIEKVEWIAAENLDQILENSYENIKLLFSNKE